MKTLENLRKPEIQLAVTTAKLERSKALKIDAEWVLKQALTLHRRCIQFPLRQPLSEFDGIFGVTFRATEIDSVFRK